MNKVAFTFFFESKSISAVNATTVDLIQKPSYWKTLIKFDDLETV